MYKYIIKAYSGGKWTQVFGPEDITIVNKKFKEITKDLTVGTKYREDPYYAMFRYFDEPTFSEPVIPDPTISEIPL